MITKKEQKEETVGPFSLKKSPTKQSIVITLDYI